MIDASGAVGSEVQKKMIDPKSFSELTLIEKLQ